MESRADRQTNTVSTQPGHKQDQPLTEGVSPYPGTRLSPRDSVTSLAPGRGVGGHRHRGGLGKMESDLAHHPDTAQIVAVVTVVLGLLTGLRSILG